MEQKRYDCTELFGKFSGKCVVIGCGVSAPSIVPYIGKVFTIGVNDAFQLGALDMLMVNDHPRRFGDERLVNMFNARVRFFASRWVDMYKWVRCGAFVDYKVHNFTENGICKDGVLGCNRTTLFSAVCLAYMMGFRDIGMIGNDFVDNHFYKTDGRYNLSGTFGYINDTFKKLETEFRKNGCNFVNLSDVSRIDVTKVPLTKWMNQ